MAANLGTLTLDLVAKIGGFTGPLDKAARESQKKMADIRKSADIAGKAIAGLAVATATGLAVLTVNTVRAANEVSRLAQVSNSSTEEFQRYAAGAQAVGIEQDKLGDIFKDVNDKVGDFLQTGGGALADFFENVAPKVGVTAEQFRKLSGPEALGLYVSSLEKAGASQQDMTFYLEAIASDATALLPLLKNNAEGFKLLGDQAAAAGAILDNDTIRAATELQAVSILTGQAMDGLRNQIVAGLLPVLADLSGELFTVAGGTDIAKEAGQTFGNILKGLAATAFGAYAAFQAVGKSIGALAAGFSAAGVEASDLLLGPLAAPVIGAKVAKNFDAFKGALAVGFDDVGRSVEGYAKVLDGIWSAGSGEGAETDYAKRIKLIADLLEQGRQRGTSAGIVIDQNSEKTKKATDAIQSQIEALQLQAATVGMSTREQTLFKLALDGATQSQLDQAEAALNAVDAFEKQKKALQEARDTDQYTAALRNQVELAQDAVDIEVEAIGLGQKRADLLREINAIQQEYAQRLEELASAQGTDNALSDEAYQARLEALREAMEQEVSIVEEGERRKDEARSSALAGAQRAIEDYIDSAKDLASQFENLTTGVLNGLEDTLTTFATTGKLSFKDLANSIIEDLARIAARQLTANLAQGVLGAVGGAAGGAGAGGLASAFAGLFDSGGSIAAGQWGIVGERGPEIVTGPAAVTGRQATADKLDRAIAKASNDAAGSGRSVSVQNNFDLSGMRDARQVREAQATISRAIARAVADSTRYT
ncbi:lambda family phage tail tape measure protein [Pseudomonas sp. BAY1663]|uniref:phage tail tape measure protein n=1 Tax=Pseudomonas sp. BAY1663 TaxID=1439940 RepID=UPI00042DEA35|nr:phage tail tape measure protein [Pseudomonas sp. BAY1663]EXF45275.1 lambda family phage tail tape measure protein [Pseudomonas sp. BAY1663]